MIGSPAVRFLTGPVPPNLRRCQMRGPHHRLLISRAPPSSRKTCRPLKPVMMRKDRHPPVGNQGEPLPGPSLHSVWCPYLRQRLSRVRGGSTVRCCLMRAPFLKSTQPIPMKKNLTRWIRTRRVVMRIVMMGRAMMRRVMMRRMMTRKIVPLTNEEKRPLNRSFPCYSPPRVPHPEVIVGTMRNPEPPQVRGCPIVPSNTTPTLEWKTPLGRKPSFDAPSAPFAATGESTFGGASIRGVDTARRRLRRLPRTCHQQRRSPNQPGVAEKVLGIVLPDSAPTALQRCQKPRPLHPLPGPAYWPLREVNPPGWNPCGHATSRLPGSLMRKEQDRRSLASAP